MSIEVIIIIGLHVALDFHPIISVLKSVNKTLIIMLYMFLYLTMDFYNKLQHLVKDMNFQASSYSNHMSSECQLI